MRVRILAAETLVASCVRLELTSTEGALLRTLDLVRDQNELRVAVYRGELPETLRFRAVALVGDDCSGSTAENSRTADKEGTFQRRRIPEVLLELSPPRADEDVDGDGHSAGPADCDDGSEVAHVGAPEACLEDADLNCNGLKGCADPTCSLDACTRVASKLVFTSAPQTLGAGACSGEVRLQTQDPSGVMTAVTSAAAVTLGADPAVVSFYSDSGCQTEIDSLTLAAGGSTGAFYFRATKAGSVSLVASAANLAAGQQQADIQPGPPTVITLDSPSTLVAGECGAVTTGLNDQYGNPAAPATARSVNLVTNPGGLVSFYSDPACSSAASLPLSISSGNNPRTVYVRSVRANAGTLSATSSGLTTVSRSLTVAPGPASALSLPDASLNLGPGACVRVDFSAVDLHGNVATLAAPHPVALAVASGSVTTHASAGCTSPTSSVSLSTAGRAAFYLRAGSAGPFRVDASATGLAADSLQGEVGAAVRRGNCALSSNQTWVSCEIGGRPVDVTRAFVLHQATSASNEPRYSSVRCGLTSPTSGNPAVLCARHASSGTVNIHWQLVELPGALTVTQRNANCTSDSNTYSLNRTVTESRTLTLFGASVDGTVYSINDFRTAYLSGSGQVELAAGNTDCRNAQFIVQAAEWTGVSVQRGVTAAMTGESVAVSGLPVAPIARSFLLHTHRVPEDTMETTERTVFGRITGGGTLEFTRHKKGPAKEVSAIAWERVTLPEGSRVQEIDLVLAEQILETTLDIAAVDPGRTLVFASGQGTSGQANGAAMSATASYASTRATFELLDATHVRVRRADATAGAQFTLYVAEIAP